MDFELAEEDRMLRELVHRFVKDELMPLEAGVLKREAEGGGLGIGEKETARLDAMSKSLGLWGLDAPSDVGGSDLSYVPMRRVSAGPICRLMGAARRCRPSVSPSPAPAPIRPA